ncbi:unnamed protein product, partial [Ixodes persulcatus]
MTRRRVFPKYGDDSYKEFCIWSITNKIEIHHGLECVNKKK